MFLSSHFSFAFIAIPRDGNPVRYRYTFVPNTIHEGDFQMNRLIRTLLCLLCCAALFPAAALAQECFNINVDALDMTSLNDSAYVQANLSAPAQGLRVTKYVSDSTEFAARVRLTIMQAETSTVVFDKNYGYVSGTFDSGDIYLPYIDNSTIPYLITLTVEDWVYAMPFMQLQSRLTDNSGCTYGIRLRDANATLTDSWVMGTMLDLDALRAQGSMTLPLCASNQYLVGQASLLVNGDQFSVSLAFASQANVELQGCAVYLIGNVAGMTTVDPAEMPETAYAIGQTIDIAGLDTALLYLPLSLSYDPAGLPELGSGVTLPDLDAQWLLWQQNLAGYTDAPDPAAETQFDPFPTDSPQPEVTPEQTPLPETPQPEDTAPAPETQAVDTLSADALPIVP